MVNVTAEKTEDHLVPVLQIHVQEEFVHVEQEMLALQRMLIPVPKMPR